MSDWNSAQYLKFKAQRTQPAIDLAARISGEPAEIIDLGCGPGNSTRVLKERFPSAHIVGVDSSESMIAAAREGNSDLEFEILDVSGELSEFSGRFDVVFSNACLQWIPDHRRLIPKIFGLLKTGGTLGVQIPMNFDEPIHKIIGRVSGSERWRGKVPERIFGTLTAFEYFDILSGLTDDFEIWHTVYCHRMPSVESIIEWYRSTGLRPYHNALDDSDGAEFVREVYEELSGEYHKQKNGEVIFRFPRFFFIAKKG